GADPLVDLSDTIIYPRGNLLRVRSGRAALYGIQDAEAALGLFGQLIIEGVEFLADFRVTGLQPVPLAPITVLPPLLRPIALDFLDVEHALPVRRHAVLDPRVRYNIGHTLPVGRTERIGVRVRSVERNQDLAVILSSGLGVTPVRGRAGGESCSAQVVLCLLRPSYGGPQLIDRRSDFWGRGAPARIVPLPPNRLVALDRRPDFLREVERPNRVRMGQDSFGRLESGPETKVVVLLNQALKGARGLQVPFPHLRRDRRVRPIGRARQPRGDPVIRIPSPTHNVGHAGAHLV